MNMNDTITKKDLQEILQVNNAQLIEQTSKAVTGEIGEVLNDMMQRIDERFEKVDVGLFKIEQKMDEHDRQLQELKEGQNKIFDILDGIAKKQEIDDDERLVLQHQLNKMITWAKQVADKVGVELTAL